MKTIPVNMTLPADLAAQLRDKADQGQIRSVSSYVADLIAERLAEEASEAGRRARVDAYIRQHLAAPDDESEAFVAGVIADLKRQEEQR